MEETLINKLRAEKVSHADVKQILKEPFDRRKGAPGLHSNKTLKANGQDYSYALFAPEPETEEQTFPLIVVLHGMGGSGPNTLPAWVERLNKQYVIISPSYPMGAWWSKNAEQMVMKLIRETAAEYPVDFNRIFIAGLSNGAIGAYMMGMFYPDLFAGVIPIAGSITPRYMHFLVNLNHTPVYMIQGKYDPMFPIGLSRRVYQILSDMKYPAVYREHEEKGSAHGGHFMPESEVAPLVAWMSQQKRSPNPKTIRMTREANHMNPIYWAQLSRGYQLAALQIPGPEQEPINLRDGKIGTLFALFKGDNLVEVMGKNVIECELYLSEDMIDFDKPVIVTRQTIEDSNNQLIPGPKLPGYHQRARKDIGVLLRHFKDRRDPELLYDAKIKISWEESVGFAQRQ